MEQLICPAPDCGKPFTSWKFLAQHTRLAHRSSLAEPTQEELKCRLCEFQGTRTTHLSRHYHSVHDQDAPLPVPQLAGRILSPTERGGAWGKRRMPKSKKKFHCDQCDSSSKTAAGLKTHVTRAHGNGQHRSNGNGHLATMPIARMTRLPSGRRVFYCPCCGTNIQIVEQALNIAGGIQQ